MLNAIRLEAVREMAAQEAREYIHRGEVLDFSSEIQKNQQTIREMIGTDDGAEAFLKKINYDLVAGQDAVPLLYKPIYETVSDPSMGEMFVDELMGDFQVVFLKKLEGGEVTFGALGPSQEKTVRILTYAAGLEYTEDMVVYNKLFQITRAGQAFGRAYNMLLNHLHLGPIIAGTYTTTGGGLAAQKVAQEEGGTDETGIAQEIAFDTTIEKTLQNAVQVFPNGFYIMCNSFDTPAIQNAIAASMLADLSPSVVKQRLNPANIIEYEGGKLKVGKKTYTYDGVAAGDCYIVSKAKTNFIEYIKTELQTDSDNGDLSRLIVSQLVGRFRRGVTAGIGGRDGAIKVNLS